MDNSKKHALVAGGLGVIGRKLVEHLSTLPDWKVTALSRRKPDFETAAQFISVDLLDSVDTRARLTSIGDVTHIFYAAYQESNDPKHRVDANLAMLVNTVEAVDAASGALRRVCLFEGGKYYGSHLGAYPTPAREDDARQMPPMFYYDQEDWLRKKAHERPWDHVVLRPDIVCGFAVGNPMNLAMVIAAYAAISKELGLPLRFPGTAACYDHLAQVTGAAQLAEGSVWAAEEAEGGEAFNITNGDVFRWRKLWQKFARYFDMRLEEPMPMTLSTVMADKEDVWNNIVAKHKLNSTPFAKVVAWGFGDYIFHRDFDAIFSTTKIRQAGFHKVVDSESMFLRLFDELRFRRVIP
jgi:nucleoside-diphosphate-sugar epimerase